MGKPFEFNSVTEMHWINFRRYLDRVLQPEEGSWRESKRANVLVCEARRQEKGLGMSQNIKINEGELNLTWFGSNYKQIIRMYESDLSPETDSMLETSIIVGKFNDGEVLSIMSFLNEYSIGKPGFTYHFNSSNELILLYRVRFNTYNQNEAFIFFLPILWRQHAYAYSIDFIFADNQKYKSYVNKDYKFDSFVLSILSSKTSLSALGETEVNEERSPEGVLIENFFRGNLRVETFKKIAKHMSCYLLGYEEEGSVSILRFAILLKPDDDLVFDCILEYSDSFKNPRFTGVPLVSEIMTPDPAVSFYISWPMSESLLSFDTEEKALLAKKLIDLYIATNKNIPIIGNSLVLNDNNTYRLNFVEVAYSPSQLAYNIESNVGDFEFYKPISNYLLLARDNAFLLAKVFLEDIKNNTLDMYRNE